MFKALLNQFFVFKVYFTLIFFVTANYVFAMKPCNYSCVQDTITKVKIIFWDGTNQVYTFTEYRNGKKNGRYIMYHDNGIKFIETTYLNDDYHGLFQSFYKNGNKLLEGYSMFGRQTGKWITYSKLFGKKKEVIFNEIGVKIEQTFFLIGLKIWNQKCVK